LNLKAVEKGYGSRSVLHDVTLGTSAGERIGARADHEWAGDRTFRSVLLETKATRAFQAGDTAQATWVTTSASGSCNPCSPAIRFKQN